MSCHVKPALQVKPRSDTCATCHTDPHRGVFKQDCASCHTETTFKKNGTGAPSGFDHSSTRFPLVDAHAATRLHRMPHRLAGQLRATPRGVTPPAAPSRGGVGARRHDSQRRQSLTRRRSQISVA